MHRTTLNLTDQQHKAIQKLTRETGLGYAELVRRLIDEALEARAKKE